MSHSDYIGKTIGELVKDTESYSINFYDVIIINGEAFHLTDYIKKNMKLDRTIISISELHSDYTYYIKLGN